MTLAPGQRLIRVGDAAGRARAAIAEREQVRVLASDDLLGLLQGSAPATEIDAFTVRDADTLAPPPPWRLLVPLVAPETWAAGVTYERSRQARVEESQVQDVYDLVYDAERPELFLKDAGGRRTVGPGGTIAARSDSAWTVPEPELAIVLGDDGEPLAVTIGNDVSARDIEGANPLYLPQAKIYAGACALGPALVVPEDWAAPFQIELRILGPGGELVFSGQTSTAAMKRSFAELVGFLQRDNPLQAGTVLLTGTGIVPPDDVSLTPQQTVEIHVPGIGTLVNPVARPQDPM